MQTFKSDLEGIRRRAREKMEAGAVTAAYVGDPEKVVDVLNDVLATELVCTLRYKHHYFTASGIHGEQAAAEFLEHAMHEQQHADRVAERITRLGGDPNLDPVEIARRSHAPYVAGENLEQMLRANLVAERIAIQTYSEIVRWLGDDDPTTRRMMEDLLAQEEEHADDLARMLAHFTRRAKGG